MLVEAIKTEPGFLIPINDELKKKYLKTSYGIKKSGNGNRENLFSRI